MVEMDIERGPHPLTPGLTPTPSPKGEGNFKSEGKPTARNTVILLRTSIATSSIIDHHAMEQDNSTTISLWATKLVLTYPVWKGMFARFSHI